MIVVSRQAGVRRPRHGESADAHRPPDWFHFHRRRLGRRGDIGDRRGRGDFVRATTVAKDQRRAAPLAQHHRSQFRPFPARRAADVHDHRSFSAVRRRRGGGMHGRCRDRDRVSTDRVCFQSGDEQRWGCRSRRRNLSRVRLAGLFGDRIERIAGRPWRHDGRESPCLVGQ